MALAQENVNNYFGGSRSYLDKKTGVTIVNVHAGDCFTTKQDGQMAATILGSCISACIHDPIAKIGGMNHFLLPSSNSADGESARFGAFAMEQLMNDLMKLGGRKDRFEIKIFGGGNVIENSSMIGDKNINFVKEYLRNEGLKIVAEDVGGTTPRKVRYTPYTGKAMIMRIEKKDDLQRVKEEEESYSKTISTNKKDVSDSIELF